MRRLAYLLPVLLFALVAGGLGIGLRRDPSLLPSMLIDRPLPAFDLPGVTPDDPQGLASADFTGKPALLNVFASWCVACVIEHPMLMRLEAEGVTIHGLDWKDDPIDGARWLAENGDPYALIGADPRGRTGIDLGVTGAPETFVVDGRGRVRYRHVGPITPEVWSETLQPMMDRLERET